MSNETVPVTSGVANNLKRIIGQIADFIGISKNGKSNVSRRNVVVSSYIYGTGEKVSPRNIVVNSDLKVRNGKKSENGGDENLNETATTAKEGA